LSKNSIGDEGLTFLSQGLIKLKNI